MIETDSKNKAVIFQQRTGLILLLASIHLSISFLTRITLLIFSIHEVDFSFINVVGIFGIGLFYDLINATYFLIPFILYLWLIPQKLFSKKWFRFINYGVFFFFIFLLLLNAVSEWFFWNEFTTRFNFIAVDYLVYTTEVLGNIQQSYPIGWIIAALLTIVIIILFKVKHLIKTCALSVERFKKRCRWAIPLLLLPVLSYFTVNSNYQQFSSNRIVNDLSGNGLYELFAAYLNNELDYKQFYPVIEEEECFENIHTLLNAQNSEFLNNNSFQIERRIKSDSSEKKLNIILISVESLSAEYLETFGNTEQITPFLDSLSNHSLFFTQVYATGTRTVRGLEALSLCIPPTPGQSIVRRPDNENLFSMWKVFRDKGYATKFIYGGYGYFDNMGYFFANNSYEVSDREKLSDDEIDYENIWGVADENLFELCEREIEKEINNGKPVFAHIMTTSNHRPFTYPEGRINIPSHTSRQGAVKYTDYSIGKFINSCSGKSWFDNTVFVIVADHCASSAGKTELPVNKYHIPLWIYSPSHISPHLIDRLMSQIDIGPTLLGLLNFSYTSKFFGFDIFKIKEGDERAFISTYQSLGYLKGNKLVVLSPKKSPEVFTYDPHTGTETSAEPDSILTNEAITWYQAASIAFKTRMLKTN